MAMNQIRNDHIKYLWGRLRHLAFTIGRLNKISSNVQVYGASRNVYSLKRNRYDTATDFSNSTSSKGVFGPHSNIRNYWSLMMMLVLTYTAFVTPYVVCYVDTEDFNLEVVEYTVDGLFFLDILINLNSSFYDKEGILVCNRWRIIIRYARSWLLLDFVGCFPIALLMPEEENSESDYNKLVRLLRIPRLYRLVRVLGLLKLMQLHKSNRFAKTVLNILKNKRYQFELIKFGITVVILVHMVGCFWYLLAKVNDINPETWVARLGLIDASNTTIYITSVYWVITTLTTVGYGDITPYTPEERIFALFLMAFGVGFYSYTISNLSNIMAKVDARASTLKAKLINLHVFAKATALPESIQRRLRGFVLINHEGNISSWINQDYLLNELPCPLRTQVSLHMHHRIVEKISFFQDKHPSFIANIVPKFRIIYVERGDFLYKEHEHPDEVYFMTRGRVFLLARNGEEFMSYVQGSYFGEVEIIEGTARNCTVQVCSPDAELLELTKAHFLTMLKDYPKIAEEIIETSGMRSSKNATAKQEALDRRPFKEPESVPRPVVRRKNPSKTFRYPTRRRSVKKNSFKHDSQQERNKKMWQDVIQKSRWSAVIDKVVGLNRNRNRFCSDAPQPLVTVVPGGSRIGIVEKVLQKYPARSKWNVVRLRSKELVLGNRLINKIPLQTPPSYESRDMLRNTRNFLKQYRQELNQRLENATAALNATRNNSEQIQKYLDQLRLEINKYIHKK